MANKNLGNLFDGSKLMGNLGRVAEWNDLGMTNPLLMEIDMTNVCDHKCPLCTYAFTRNSQSLSFETQVKPLLNQAQALDVKAVVFTGGGESLINPDTPISIQYAQHLGFNVGLITHGGKITKKIAETIVLHNTWVRVSLDAANPEMFLSTHGVKNHQWDATIKGIQNLVEARKEMASLVTIGIGYLVDERTIVEAKQAVDLATELEVDYIQFRPFRETNFDIRPLMAEIKAASEGSNTKVIFSEAKYDVIGGPRAYSKCSAVDFSFAVGADYKVYACCDTKYQPDACIGDLNTTTLDEIWNDKRMDGPIFSFCPQPCRHDGNNRFLDSVKQQRMHVNFI